MIKHIVMWTLMNKADGRSKSENIELLREKLLALPDKISQIVDYEVGINLAQSPSAYDVVLYSTFESPGDLDVYRKHPDHVEVANFIAKVRDKTAVVDYEL